MHPSPNKVLIVAFHFPPCELGSGYMRSLKFAEYLPDFGWRTHVLTVHPRAHGMRASDAKPNPAGVPVERVFALDVQRHLSIRGKYPDWFGMPDRWFTWFPAALLKGLSLIRRGEVNAIFSTYPIPTAQYIGLALKRLTGKPWIADFRDPLVIQAEEAFGIRRLALRRLDRLVITHADRIVFTAPSALEFYANRYPLHAQKMRVIENGYDESTFEDISVEPRPQNGPLKILHSGLVYKRLRGPLPFLDALVALKASGAISAERVQVIFRAAGTEVDFDHEIRARQLQDVVTQLPATSHREAVREMMAADGLMVMQGELANCQVPAKIYEYLRAQRPIFGLTHPGGDTSVFLAGTGVEDQANIGLSDDIEAKFDAFLDKLEKGQGRTFTADEFRAHSRYARAEQLAKLLDEVEQTR